MSIIVDLIIVAICIVTLLIYSKKGFVASFCEVAGFILALLVAINVGNSASNFTYDKIIEPSILKSVSEAYSDTADKTAQEVIDKMPDFITENLDKFGLTSEKLSSEIQKSEGAVAQSLKTISQNNIKPVITDILSLIFTVLLFIILLIVVKILSKLLNKLFSISIVGKLNKFLGGIIGIAIGAVYSCIFCLVVRLAVTLTQNGFLIFTNENLANTHIYNWVISILPF